MTGFIGRALLSGMIIAGASWLARTSPRFAGILIAVPFVTVLTMWWLWRDTHDSARIATLSWSVFWAVLPTLGFLALLPVLLKAGWSFPAALAVSLGSLILCFGVYAAILRRLGIAL